MVRVEVDCSKCVACGVCIKACQEAHKLPVTMRYRYIRPNVGFLDNEKPLFKFTTCRHCEQPACMDVCVNNVYYRDDEGRVLRREEHCIHCGKCIEHCSYGAIQIDHATGMIGKCDLCACLKDSKQPVCVMACPMQAIFIVN